MYILAGLFFTFIIVALPIFMQRTAHQSIDEKKYKLYKIKHLGFLFKGMQGESASNYGVIMPMLIIQMQGYVLGVIALGLIIYGEIFNFLIYIVIIIIMTLIHELVSIAVTVITGYIGNKR